MRADVLISLFLIASCAWLYTITAGFPEGAETFPRLMLISTIVFSAAILLDALRSGSASNPSRAPAPIKAQPYVVFGGATLYVMAVGVLGFFTSSILFSAATMAYMGVRRISAYLVALGTMALFYYVLFDRFLHIPLPRGLLY